MPRPDYQGQGFDGQDIHIGGMNCLNAVDNQYECGINIVIRDGFATTRPGIRRTFRNFGMRTSFWFDNFWFPFVWATGTWGSIQGFGIIKLPTDDNEVMLLVKEGTVYKVTEGFTVTIPTEDVIGVDEEIRFTQADDKVIMWRGEDHIPQIWDGSVTGFTDVPPPVSGDTIPNAKDGVYCAGRLWCYTNRSTMGCSDIFDFSTWDLAGQTFTVNPGDGDEIIKILPFHDEKMLVFKRHSVYLVTGYNTKIESGHTLAEYIVVSDVDTHKGAVSPNGVVIYGEQVAWFGYGGIYTLQRNEENNLMGVEVPISRNIQSLIDRVNWSSEEYLENIQAINYDNYLLFAVPLDGRERNNSILVYDIIAGAWVGQWQSQQTKVAQFFKMKDKLYYVGYDGLPRQMFTNDPCDSDDPVSDTPAYEVDLKYFPGDTLSYTSEGDTTVYRCIQESKGNVPTNTSYFEVVTDVECLYNIESQLITRKFRHQDWSPKMLGRGEILFAHQDPKIDIFIRGCDYTTEEQLFSNKEYPRQEYDIVKSDWDVTNINLDMRDPHRKDYTVFIPSDSELVPEEVIAEFIAITGTITPDITGLYRHLPNPTATPWNYWVPIADWSPSITDPGPAHLNYIIITGDSSELWIKLYALAEPLVPPHMIPAYWEAVVYHSDLAHIEVSMNPYAGGTGNAYFETEHNVLLCDSSGFDLDVWECHTLRFLKRLLNDRVFQLRIVNKRGKIALHNISMAGSLKRFAGKDN